MALRINNKRCDTCIFGSHSPIGRERFSELHRQWQEEKVHQECHHATIAGEHAGCRGHYDAAKATNDQSYPVVDTVRDIFQEELSAESCFQIAERMGWVHFVDVK